MESPWSSSRCRYISRKGGGRSSAWRRLCSDRRKASRKRFLACSADICIYGGAAGGGKRLCTSARTLRHIGNKQFAAVTFRRTNPQILSPGGLWSESFNIYSLLGATPKLSPKPMWVFPSGATITFSHLEMESTKYDWQGSQIPLIMFDELTHFSESVFSICCPVTARCVA